MSDTELFIIHCLGLTCFFLLIIYAFVEAGYLKVHSDGGLIRFLKNTLSDN